MIVIVMGVSGSGKSYLAERLAQATTWPFAEGDDFHSEANKTKMAARIPLTDEDRQPWLASLHAQLLKWHQHHQYGIMTCSALKAAYRELLAAGIPELCFVWLDPSREILEQRVAHRPGHYMPAALLDSQLATLEPPIGNTGSLLPTLRLDGTEPIDQAINAILTWLDELDSPD
jgi:gluconokinase